MKSQPDLARIASPKWGVLEAASGFCFATSGCAGCRRLFLSENLFG
jgi:hypothetical protein